MATSRILAADIGGTNARFASFHLTCEGAGRQLELERVNWLPTEKFTDTKGVVAAFKLALKLSSAVGPDTADALAIALAGPVVNGRGSLTNGALSLDMAEVNSGISAFLCNDFLAQAYACASQPGRTARPVLVSDTGKQSAEEVCAVVGAGTGLGAAMLCRCAGRIQAFPSEAGHASFAFAGGEEERLREFILRHTGLPYVVGDVVLSGRGLVLLHRFLTGEDLRPREVSQCALGGDTPTLRWYSRLYGRFCRNVALTTLCTGGLWIAGGIAADNPLVVTGGDFAEEFYASPRYEALLRTIPVHLVEDKNSGLWGAAYGACLQLPELL